jgi:hypothetical protein
MATHASFTAPCSTVTAQPLKALAIPGTDSDVMPNPGLAASPHDPENTGPPLSNTIFWRRDDFGVIKRDVHAIFSGAIYMWNDPVPSNAKTQRGDFETNLGNLLKHEKKGTV